MSHEHHFISNHWQLRHCLYNSLFRLTGRNMMTSSNENIFLVTGHLCGEFTIDRWIPAQRPVRRSSNVLFDPHLNKRLSKQWWGWWFETSSCPLWRHCNETHKISSSPNLGEGNLLVSSISRSLHHPSDILLIGGKLKITNEKHHFLSHFPRSQWGGTIID